MTIRGNIDVIHAKPDHAAATWQAPTSLVPARPAPIFTRPKTLFRPRRGSRATMPTSVKSRRLFPAASPPPRNIARPNLLSP